MIQLGLRLHDGEKLPIEQLLPLVRDKGFSCVHLALSKSLKEIPCTPSALTPGYAGWLRRLCQRNDLDIAVLGNYLNLAHPDEKALAAIQEKYYAHIRFAANLGCGMVGTETGAPNPEYRTCPECRGDQALAAFIRNLKPVVRCAESYGITLVIEPVIRHIVWNPRRCRAVLDEIGSHNLQVLFDPVNLLDETNVDRKDEVFAEAIELWGKDIAMVHLKDYRRDEIGALRETGAGLGEMDYSRIMAFLKAEKPYIYATLENTTPENAVFCREAMQRAYDNA